MWNEAVAAELCGHISSLKREWVVLSEMEFSLILALYSSAAAAASRVSRQNQPIFTPSPAKNGHDYGERFDSVALI